MADNETTVHELGHRYYDAFLSGQARKAWEQFYNDNIVHITNNEADEVRNAIEKAYPSAESRENVPWISIKHLKNEVTKKKFTAWMEQQGGIKHAPFGLSGGWDKEEKERRLKNFIKSLEGEKVLLPYISEYGATNEKEAYAEAFMSYVMDKKIDPVAMQMFKQVTGII